MSGLEANKEGVTTNLVPSTTKVIFSSSGFSTWTSWLPTFMVVAEFEDVLGDNWYLDLKKEEKGQLIQNFIIVILSVTLFLNWYDCRHLCHQCYI